MVNSGVYNELLDINKTISIIGEHKNTVIINFNPNFYVTQVPVININANNCSVKNLQINLGNKSTIVQGIKINTKYNTIQNLMITNFSYGIELTAYSESNTIRDNYIAHNTVGIDGTNSLHNTIANNTITLNTQYGIYMDIDSDNNIISYNTITYTNYGPITSYSDTSGIRIKGSQNNQISNNCLMNNYANGLYFCCGATNNLFYNNTLINNSKNGKDGGHNNLWYNSPGNSGNYWSDYTGSDTNQDGIGDTPYNITGTTIKDLYPLMNPPSTPCSS